MMIDKDKSSKLKIIGNSNNNDQDKFLSTAATLQHNKKEKFSTGSTYLDAILGGGIESGSITQIYGASGSGKSQICFTTCVLLPIKYSSIYVDTEGKVRIERIKQIAEKRGIESDNLLKNIYISQPTNSQEMEITIDHISDFSSLNNNNNIKLLIVDSLINPYRVEYQGRSKLPERQQKISLLMSKIRKLANEKKVAVIITNHIQTDPISSYSFNNEMPVGGNILKFSSTHIVSLKKYRNNTHACLIQSNWLPYHESYFIVTEKGIENERYKDKKGES